MKPHFNVNIRMETLYKGQVKMKKNVSMNEDSHFNVMYCNLKNILKKAFERVKF